MRCPRASLLGFLVLGCGGPWSFATTGDHSPRLSARSSADPWQGPVPDHCQYIGKLQGEFLVRSVDPLARPANPDEHVAKEAARRGADLYTKLGSHEQSFTRVTAGGTFVDVHEIVYFALFRCDEARR